MPPHSSTPVAWYLDARPDKVTAWLLRLRWTRTAVDLIVIATALVLVTTEFPLRRIVPLIAAGALANADLAWQLSRARAVAPWMRGAALAIDVALLTALLELSGGPSNPFSVVYLAAIALAAATLGGGWGWAMAAWATVCYGALIAWHLEELVPAHHRLVDFPTHLFTIWLTVVLTAELVGHFVREASAAILRREAQIQDMRSQAARSERLMSLTTLAAGAAHELSTPLATIAVASHELDRALARLSDDPNAARWAADARLIREQVQRCQGILDQMSGRAGGSAAESSEPIDVAAVFADVRGRLAPELADRVRLHVPAVNTRIRVPRAGLVQVLLSLVKNAFDASDASRPVTLEGIQEDHRVRLIVRDQGHGMRAEVLQRAGEPFFTTKDAGAGFGLGLFLARMFAERCGGTLTLESGRGTTATLDLPLSPSFPALPALPGLRERL